MKRKGSITVWLLLLLSVILLLFGVMRMSLRIEGGKSALKTGAAVAAYSLFGRYDRELYERYGLLFINGDCGQTQFSPGIIADTLAYEAAVSWGSAPLDKGFCADDLWELSYPGVEITDYVLACDTSGRAFLDEILEIQSSGGAARELKLISELISSHPEVFSGEKLKIMDFFRMYDRALKEARKAAPEDMPEEDAEVIPLQFRTDPIKSLRELLSFGPLGLMDLKVSEETVAADKLLSRRKRNTGIGLEMPEKKLTVRERLQFLQYVSGHLGNAAAGEDKKGGLNYEMEYLLMGKASDRENLKGTVDRLLLLRFGDNLRYLETSSSKRGELAAAAAGVAALTGLPLAQGVLEQVLLATWAYAESLLDVKILLAGGKVPFPITDRGWQIEAERLGDLPDLLTNSARGRGNGMDYAGYLLLMMFPEKQDTLVMRTMDMIEADLRQIRGKNGFSFDHCIYRLRAGFQARLQGVGTIETMVERSYGVRH